jgi:hypothetical protein
MNRARWLLPLLLLAGPLQAAPPEGEFAPPWPPAYKLKADDPRLTEADVVGPDGIVYPDWRMAGVPGGIPRVANVIEPAFFTGLEGQDLAPRLVEAIRQAHARGGGAIQLPPGQFYLDQQIVLRESGIVIRGAGRDKTRLIFRGHIPLGEARFFNWAGTGQLVGPGGVIEVQANPKNLNGIRIEANGKLLKEVLRETDPKGWGNRFTLRLTGKELIAALGEGEHRLEAALTYADGRRFTQSFPVTLSRAENSLIAPDQNGIVTLVGPGRRGAEIPLVEDGKRGSRKLAPRAGHGLKAGDRVLVEAPATERWKTLVGDRSKANRFRQCFFEITAATDNSLILNQPLRLEFPLADGAFIQKVEFIQGSGIENLTLEQQVAAPHAVPPDLPHLRYWYPVEDLWLNGASTAYAWGCWIKGVGVVNAGRNPLYLTRSKFCEIRDSEADGALFKGSGGTAYVGVERAFDCLLDNVTTRDMRHAPNLQWGAAGNVIRNSRFYGSDAQWHAGWANENLLEGNLITATAEDVAKNNGYGYGLFATGPNDTIHGPEGPRNVAYRNEVVSPKDGLRMWGGNEGWIIAYNRFRITEGLAVYVGEKSFDHVIRENVFMLERCPAKHAVQVEGLDSTGLELQGNTFHGPVTKLAAFRHPQGALSRDEGNRLLPYRADALAPSPAVPSIFEWQRSTVTASQPPRTESTP